MIAILICPVCKLAMTLSPKIHSVAADGVLTPSLVCPHIESPGCSFHEWARLDEWSRNP